MKKIVILTFISLLVATLSTFAQLQITEYGQAYSMREYEKNACSIYWIEDGYYFAAWDYDCALYNLVGDQYNVLIYLGKTNKEVEQSKCILENWFKTALSGSYIYVTNPNGQRVCIYKYNSNLYCSYGTELDCKITQKKYSSSLASMIAAGAITVLTGVDQTTNVANSYERGRKELLANIEFGTHVLVSGVSFKKDLMRSFENFLIAEDNKVKFITDNYTQKILYKVSQVHKLYKTYNLLESTVYNTFYAICNPYMSSVNPQDWLSMERACDVMLHIVSKDPQFKREDLENELLNALSREKKEEIFNKYYKFIVTRK